MEGGAAPEPLCANCKAPLLGAYCYVCGQSAESPRRSVWSLLREATETFLEADWTVVHTLPRLVFRPATLTNDFITGRRASQTPPLRLFLVVIVLVFFVGGLGQGRHPTYKVYTPDSPSEADGSVVLAPVFLGGGPAEQKMEAWLKPRLKYAVTHQQEFGATLAEWMHRIAILFLPVATLILSLIFAFRRRYLVYDHAIFSMHSLSFMGLLFSLVTLMGLAPPLRVFGLLGFAAPVHLFAHMRGVYGTGVVGTLLRMGLLFALSVLGLSLLMGAAVMLDLYMLPAQPGA